MARVALSGRRGGGGGAATGRRRKNGPTPSTRDHSQLIVIRVKAAGAVLGAAQYRAVNLLYAAAMSAPVLSPGEERAEELLYAALSRKYSFKEFVIEARFLERENPEAGAYLRYLHARFIVPDRWPKVASGRRKPTPLRLADLVPAP